MEKERERVGEGRGGRKERERKEMCKGPSMPE